MLIFGRRCSTPLNGQDMVTVSTYVNRFHRTWTKGYWGMGNLGVICGH